MPMLMTVTNAVVSKGYNDQPAIRFNEKGNFVRFRFGNSKYDKNALNNRRWINMSAKAYDSVCERIKKMQLQEGAHVTLVGEYDEESWTDNDTKEQKTAPCLTLVFIDYAGGGNGNRQAGDSGSQSAAKPAADESQVPPPDPQVGNEQPAHQTDPQSRQSSSAAGPPSGNDTSQMPDSFDGFQSFDAGGNPYFSEEN